MKTIEATRKTHRGDICGHCNDDPYIATSFSASALLQLLSGLLIKAPARYSGLARRIAAPKPVLVARAIDDNEQCHCRDKG
jgi:hypothetical protein